MWNICLYVYTCILYMWMYVAAEHGKLYNISFPATGKKKIQRGYTGSWILKLKKKKILSHDSKLYVSSDPSW